MSVPRRVGANLLLIGTFPLLVALLIVITIVAVVGRLIKAILGIDKEDDQSDETCE